MSVDQSKNQEKQRTTLVYHQCCHDHKPDKTIAEHPGRLDAILKHLESEGYSERCAHTQGVPLSPNDPSVAAVHTDKHLSTLWSLCAEAKQEKKVIWKEGDLYVSSGSQKATLAAAGGVCTAARLVVEGKSQNAFAVVRPPGHHAEPNKCMGYCLLNNVAIAARHLLRKYPDRVKKILILDWDVHHGNGIQEAFEADDSVLYMSIHRHQKGKFYPYTGKPSEVGSGDGKGFTINMPLPCPKLDAIDYERYFDFVVLPVAREFAADVIFVSAGFDCVLGDHVGGMLVPPHAFGHFTRKLMSLNEGKLVMALEGGYNLRALSESVKHCISSLLGDKLPPLKSDDDNSSFLAKPKKEEQLRKERIDAFETELINVIEIQKKYWGCLKLPPKREATKEEKAPAKRRTKKKTKVPARFAARMRAAMDGKKRNDKETG